MKLLIGVTGSVAAIKIPKLLDLILEEIPNAEIKLAVTKSSKHFFNIEEVVDKIVAIHDDEHEWRTWQKVGDPVLHIELRRWADVMLIAPADANTIAKMANGLCDNLLTCIVRAWDLSKPLLFCPAMNTMMWDHPLTAKHLFELKKLGYVEIPCVVKKLACNDHGMGAMAALPTIVSSVKEASN